MVKRFTALFTLAACMAMLVACGGRQSGVLLDNGAPPDLGGAASPGNDLPELSQLPSPQRELSIVGPGFFDVPLEEMVARNGATSGPGTLTLDGAGSTAYVIYGVFGFDGDNGPTSARITTSAVDQEYFVCFSDYIAGQWQIAGPFTDSAEVEIPGTDEYTSPTAYTSPSGTCYLGVICSPGDSMTLTAVELGVQGGVLGPEAPLSLDGTGDAPNFFLQWSNCPSYKAPDFAGYILQRAPLLEGDFVSLYPDPLEEPFFNDSTAESDVLYRYRLCSEDSSGNRSVWRNLIDGPLSGEKTNPVLRLDLPLGPLHGPVDVMFDLGGSFDPEGEGITSYALVFLNGLAPVTGGSPTFTVTLQPGCYTIIAQVECAGPPARDTTNIFHLLVYPRWNEAPVVVREPDNPTLFDVRRLMLAQGSLNTSAQRITLCGIDISNIGICFYGAPASNPADLSVARLPIYFFPNGASQALEVGNTTFYAVSTPNYLSLTQFDGDTVSQRFMSGQSSNGKVALAYDGSQIWVIYDFFDGLNTNLHFEPTAGGVAFDAVAAIGVLTSIDAQFNPATGTIDVVYGDAAGPTTEWVRVDADSATVVDSANIDPAAAAVDIDLELDPTTGRPIVAYSHTSIHRFRELNAVTVWTPEVQIDNGILNFTPLDLVVDDGTRYCYFRTGPTGQAVLYRDDGGAWSAVNTVAYSSDSGYEVSLIPQNGADDRALVLDMDVDHDFHLAQLHDDGTDTDIWQLPHCDGQGFDLQTAVGSDGLHAVWRSFGTLQTRHALSADAETWTDPGDIGLGFTDCGLAADTDGNVYFSTVHGLSSELYWWDGGSWNLRSAVASSGSNYRPFFSSPPNATVTWCAYDNGTTTMHYVSAHEPAYPDNPVVMATAPIWAGVTNTVGTSTEYWLGLVGGGTPNDGVITWSEIGSSFVSALYEPLLSSGLELFTTPISWGREVASTSYFTEIPIGPEQAMFCTRGKLLNPTRYTIPFLNPPQLDEIVVAKDYSLFDIESIFNEDVRDTVSCAMGYSATGLVLISSADGTRNYFAWSNYGDWEELPMPEGIANASMPQLVVGLDGRWHMIYKNWATDQMMCMSTL